MRLVTFQTKAGTIHIGALRADDHEIVVLDSVAPSMLALIDGGAEALAQAKSALAAAAKVVARADVRLLSPIPRPKQNVMCLGMNYVAHAIESLRARGSEIKLPEFPVFFTKALNTVCGDGDSVPLDPNVTSQLDYEVELAYVFGRTAKNVKKADALDCEFIATGHYVNVREENNRFVLSKGKDETKDQSYVLWGLNQACLSRSVYPLGNYRKTEIRQMAFDFGYPELAKKSESYEICFVPDNDYRGFLKRRKPELEQAVNNGKYVDKNGLVLGKHEGYPFYTIGQRKGLGLALGEPMFVTKIDPQQNTVELGPIEELNKTEMFVHKLTWQKFLNPASLESVLIKIRYKDKGHTGKLSLNGDKVWVHFDGQVAGIAPGQSAVFYMGDDVIGGGRIHSSW
jgi:tRNA (5-methylaminomethyl-2-thiouridylate)-methyltransferase